MTVSTVPPELLPDDAKALVFDCDGASYSQRHPFNITKLLDANVSHCHCRGRLQNATMQRQSFLTSCIFCSGTKCMHH
jgi:hypothetical protein